MKASPFLVLSILALVLAAGVVQAEPLTYEHEGKALFSITYPSFWYVDTDFMPEAKEADAYEEGEPGLRIVEAMPNDDSRLWFGVWVAPEGVTTLEKGLDYVSSLDGELFTDVEASEPQNADFNGMAAKTFYGSAKRQGEEVEYAVALFQARDEVIVVVLYVGQPQTWELHQIEMFQMVESIRPAGD